jgi:hypothetical protein
VSRTRLASRDESCHEIVFLAIKDRLDDLSKFNFEMSFRMFIKAVKALLNELFRLTGPVRLHMRAMQRRQENKLVQLNDSKDSLSSIFYRMKSRLRQAFVVGRILVSNLK